MKTLYNIDNKVHTSQKSSFRLGLSSVRILGLTLVFLHGLQMTSWADDDDPDQYKLTQIGQIVPGAAASAARVADLKIQALTASAENAATALQEVAKKIQRHNDACQALKEKIETYGQQVETHNAAVEAEKAQFAQQNAQVEALNSRIDASNALDPEDRDEGTVEALNSEAARLSQWGGELEAAKDRLNAEETQLEAKRSELESENTTLEQEEDALNSEQKALEFKKELAWKQLQECVEYAKQIHAKFAAEFSDGAGGYAVPRNTSSTLERLKEMSSKVFDGNTDRPELTPDLIKPPFQVTPTSQ
jgi:chromosome segregation ATPase